MKYGDEPIFMPTSNFYGAITTLTDYIWMPTEAYNEFKAKIEQLSDFTCEGNYCYSVYNSCDQYYDKMDDLKVYFEGDSTPFSIPPISYTRSYTQNSRGACRVLVNNDGSGDIIQFGYPFLRQYVASFNYADRSITLGLNAKRPGMNAKRPGTSSGSSVILMAVLGVGAVAVIAGAVFLFFRHRKKRALAVSDDYKKDIE